MSVEESNPMWQAQADSDVNATLGAQSNDLRS